MVVAFRVRTGRKKRILPRSPPREAEDLSELHQRGGQQEGEDEGRQKTAILAHQSPRLLEDAQHSPSSQSRRIPVPHLASNLIRHTTSPATERSPLNPTNKLNASFTSSTITNNMNNPNNVKIESNVKSPNNARNANDVNNRWHKVVEWEEWWSGEEWHRGRVRTGSDAGRVPPALCQRSSLWGRATSSSSQTGGCCTHV